MGLWVVTLGVNFTILLFLNRAVLLARLKRRKITEKFDKVLLPLLLPAMLAIPVVAGLDAMRYRWSDPASRGFVPFALRVFGANPEITQDKK